MPSGSMFVSACVCTYVRHETYATTAQNIQTDLVGDNRNRSKIVMHMHVDKVRSPRAVCTRRRLLGTANKRLDLQRPIFAHIFMLSWYVRRPNFVKIVNVLNLQFHGQRFESNTLARSSYYILVLDDAFPISFHGKSKAFDAAST